VVLIQEQLLFSGQVARFVGRHNKVILNYCKLVIIEDICKSWATQAPAYYRSSSPGSRKAPPLMNLYWRRAIAIFRTVAQQSGVFVGHSDLMLLIQSQISLTCQQVLKLQAFDVSALLPYFGEAA
jgi:hypothetical protein